MTNEKELAYLWKEYQYRRDLIWKIIIRIASVSVVLSGLPYAKNSVTATLLKFMCIPPGLAILLICFGSVVISNVLKLLEKIKMTYRRLQNEFFQDAMKKFKLSCRDMPDHDLKREGRFKAFVWFFLIALGILTLCNLVFLYFVWIETFNC